MFPNHQVTVKSADYLADKFFKKYKNYSEKIYKNECIKIISDIYASMGVEAIITEEDGNEMISIFSNGKEYLSIDDIKNVFRRYLCNSISNNNNYNLNNNMPYNNNNNLKTNSSYHIDNDNLRLSHNSYANSISSNYKYLSNNTYNDNIKSNQYIKSVYVKDNNNIYQKSPVIKKESNKYVSSFYIDNIEVLNKEYNFYNLQKLYFELLDKFGSSTINNAISNAVDIFNEYDVDRNKYLQFNQINLIIEDTIKLMEGIDGNLDNKIMETYMELLDYNKRSNKVLLSDYLLFTLKCFDK